MYARILSRADRLTALLKFLGIRVAMLLQDSQYKGDAGYASVVELATPAANDDGSGYRREFLGLVRRAAQLTGEATGSPRNGSP